MRRSQSRDINVERLSRNRGKIVGVVGQRHCVTSCPLVMFFRVDSDTSTSRHGSRTSISDLERKRAKPTEQNGIQGKSVLGQLRAIQFIQPGVPSGALKKDFREEVFYVLSNSCTIFVGFVSVRLKYSLRGHLSSPLHLPTNTVYSLSLHNEV